MATLPTFESVLLEIGQCLGLKRRSTKKQGEFVKLEMTLENHLDMVASELQGIFDALEMSDAARRDAFRNLNNWTGFQRLLAQNVWTFDASARQVVWHLCAFTYAPAAGRLIANWNLGEAFDHGMPGGEFWFLPHVDQKTKQLALPMQHVVGWIIDLLGLPMDQLAANLGTATRRAKGKQDSIERSLYKWKHGTIPEIKTIEEYFPDDSALNFNGTFEVSAELPHEDKVAAALAFVDRKRLNPQALRSQIPMTQPGRIEAIMNGQASTEEQAEFVRLLGVRYGKPSMRTIRQRLRTARAVQDGYKRLVEFLCPGVDFTCSNPNDNKVLQVFALVQFSYNLTVEAYKRADSEVEQDAWFEAHLPPEDRATLFRSVLPSHRPNAHTEVGDLLTHRFARLDAQAPLDDFFALDSADWPRVAQTKISLMNDFFKCLQREFELRDLFRRHSPWRLLQTEADYLVVSQLALSDDISPKAREAALARLRELAKSPEDTVGAIVCALGNLINCDISDRPRDVEQRVEMLLEEAERSPGHATWALPLLQYRAKHCLARNQFDEAAKLFKQAVDCGFERNFGSVIGEAARDLFATLVADRRLMPSRHERPYRIMLMTNMINGDPMNISIAEVAKQVAEDFWTDLYKPYPGYERRRPLIADQAATIMGDTFRMIDEEDWDSLQRWFDSNSKALRRKQTDSVRGDSVLMSWLKLLNTSDANMPLMRTLLPKELVGDVDRFTAHLKRRRHAICLLLKAWPEQANLTDFKRQSPLMVAANAGDVQIAGALLEAGADVDQQDYLGRTPLHAAVKGGSSECVVAILARMPESRNVEYGERNNALHTAVKLGRTEILPLLVEYDAGLPYQANAHGLTPLALGEQILRDWSDFTAAMHDEQVQIPDRSAYVACIEYLRGVTDSSQE
ncbi:ankyrin repeat domain-containing protein [Cupriavidus sp. L7L]|uniref:ankyrin repeat domain-containing protein n=1 Tax=Cupriavidus sp. L7L TaxID=2546443 RepID=UPI0010563D44|nr:ankyrin repeat domain-containing protein [Cupriavidus sp. L7L]TDF62058.1 ankyrin repeat domain-containing protein [Cupriavidus sp. L7L]